MDRSRSVAMKLAPVLLMVMSLAAFAQFGSDDLPRVRPQEVGFFRRALGLHGQVLCRESEQGRDGGHCHVSRPHGKVVHFSAVGYADVDEQPYFEISSGICQSAGVAQSRRIHRRHRTAGARADHTRCAASHGGF